MIVSYVSSTNFDEIEEWVNNGKKKMEPVGNRRRLAKNGAKCAMTNAVRVSFPSNRKKITQKRNTFFYKYHKKSLKTKSQEIHSNKIIQGCSDTNDPVTACWNENDVCTGDDTCLFDGWGDEGLPKAKCKSRDSQACATISSSQYGTYYEDYVYRAGDPTSLPYGIEGPPCVFPFTYGGIEYNTCATVNEPVTNEIASDQGYLGLPWCFTDNTGSNWAYCFPNGSPSCAYNGGVIRKDKGTLSSCTLMCTNGYEGYTSDPTCVNGDQESMTMPSDPVSAGCTPVLCASYTPDSSIFEESAFSDTCEGSNNVLFAGSSCTLQCKAGLESSGTGVVSCPSNAVSGQAVNVDLTCTPISCSAFNLDGLTEMSGASTNGCVQGQILTTASSSRCNIRCTNDVSENPFLYEVYCPVTSAANSPPVVSGGAISCSELKCETYVSRDSPTLNIRKCLKSRESITDTCTIVIWNRAMWEDVLQMR